MIKNIDIKNFKNIKSLKIENLKRINVIAGKNGEGKTSILDAIFIGNDILSTDCFIKPIVFRGGQIPLGNGDPWKSYFNKFDTSKNIEIIKQYDNNKKDLLEVSLKSSSRNTFQTDSISSGSISEKNILPTSKTEINTFIARLYNGENKKSELAIDVEQTNSGMQISSKANKHNVNVNLKKTTYITTSVHFNTANTINTLNDLIKSKDKDFIISNMKLINNKIMDIHIGLINGEATIFFDVGEENLISSSSMGEGIGKLLTILVTSYVTKDGIILIDELENGIHYSMMPIIIETLLEKAKENRNQIFITTHSLDIIRTLSRMYIDGKISDGDFTFNRIGFSKSRDKNTSSYFSLKELNLSTEESWEIR